MISCTPLRAACDIFVFFQGMPYKTKKKRRLLLAVEVLLYVVITMSILGIFKYVM
ncbi:MAG TPA: hypothetical protein VGD65_20690 [Chryseosolibacter sp.]